VSCLTKVYTDDSWFESYRSSGQDVCVGDIDTAKSDSSVCDILTFIQYRYNAGNILRWRISKAIWKDAIMARRKFTVLEGLAICFTSAEFGWTVSDVTSWG
jgi:hypothetical protein